MVPTPPLRWIFRSRYAALIWSFGICMMAYDYAGGSGSATVDAANSSDSQAAQVSALLAEDAG